MTNQDEALRADVRRLGDLLGQTLVRQEGQQLLDLVENVRKAVREGSGAEQRAVAVYRRVDFADHATDRVSRSAAR